MRPGLTAPGFYFMDKAIQYLGEWRGHYPGHFEQTIKLERDGDMIIATKVTGDNYVPAGEQTWRLNLKTGKAEGRIAKKYPLADEADEFVWIPAKVTFVNGRERILVTWLGMATIEFRFDGM